MKKTVPLKRRSEVEMGLEFLRVMTRHSKGATTRQLLREASVNYRVLKRTEVRMIAAGLVVKKKEGKSLMYSTGNRGRKVLSDYDRIQSYFMRERSHSRH